MGLQQLMRSWLLGHAKHAKSTTGVLCRTSWITWSHVIWTTTTSCWTSTSQKTPRCTAVWSHPSESSLLPLWFKLKQFPLNSCRWRRHLPHGSVEKETTLLGDAGSSWPQVGLVLLPSLSKFPPHFGVHQISPVILPATTRATNWTMLGKRRWPCAGRRTSSWTSARRGDSKHRKTELSSPAVSTDCV